MLREPQHERKIAKDIKTPPFVLSSSKDAERVFNSLIRLDRLAATELTGGRAA
jgi:hypothetical protein